jgi:hypothetical protein
MIEPGVALQRRYRETPVQGRSRLWLGVAVGLLAMLFMVGSAKRAAAQAADAEARCTGDVMRLCSEFVPDADAIVACLKVKRSQLTSSCLNALLPIPTAPLAVQATPKQGPPKQVSAKRASPNQASPKQLSSKKSSGKPGAPLVLVPNLH